MAIIRVKKRGRYVVIDARSVEDARLSWKARGLLAYLLTRPDDWQVRFTHLVEQAPDGRKALRSGLRELVDAGYAEVRPIPPHEGGGTEYTVYEHPDCRDAQKGNLGAEIPKKARSPKGRDRRKEPLPIKDKRKPIKDVVVAARAKDLDFLKDDDRAIYGPKILDVLDRCPAPSHASHVLRYIFPQVKSVWNAEAAVAGWGAQFGWVKTVAALVFASDGEKVSPIKYAFTILDCDFRGKRHEQSNQHTPPPANGRVRSRADAERGARAAKAALRGE